MGALQVTRVVCETYVCRKKWSILGESEHVASGEGCDLLARMEKDMVCGKQSLRGI